MSEEVKQSISDSPVKMIATANKAGKPNVSAKGSLMVLDDEHLAFVDVRSPGTSANLHENPQISIMCINPETRKGCRIWGTAEVLQSGDVFDKVAGPWTNPERKVNNVIRIAVDEAVAF